MRLLYIVAATLTLVQQMPAAGITIDFENTPALPAQPSTFAAAGAMQTYSNSHFSISGGVVLGNPTFLAAFGVTAGTPPNLYGTTDIADPSLLDTITLTFPLVDNVLGVSGDLFNGQPIAEDYTISVLSGATPLTGASFLAVPASSSTSGFRHFVLTEALPITSLTITTPNSDINGWDFLVDDITTSGVPEPSSVLLVLCGSGLLVCLRRRR